MRLVPWLRVGRVGVLGFWGTCGGAAGAFAEWGLDGVSPGCRRGVHRLESHRRVESESHAKVRAAGDMRWLFPREMQVGGGTFFCSMRRGHGWHARYERGTYWRREAWLSNLRLGSQPRVKAIGTWGLFWAPRGVWCGMGGCNRLRHRPSKTQAAVRGSGCVDGSVASTGGDTTCGNTARIWADWVAVLWAWVGHCRER